MSQSEFDLYLDQLYAEDAKVRRDAARKLGESGRPEYIAELVKVYENDMDPGVHKAAEEALVKFRQFEQSLTGGAAAGASESGNRPLLTRIRLILGILLAISILINLAVVVSNAFPGVGNITPTQGAPTARTELTSAFQKRIDQAKSDAAILRGSFSAIQGGMGMKGVQPDQCKALQAESLDFVNLADIDNRTYPDLKEVNNLINIAAPRVGVIRNNYEKLCAVKTQQDFDSALTSLGGAGKVVADIDDITNRGLSNASLALKKAIDNPAPTVGPTFTPTPSFTPTVPTDTPTPTPSITPTPTITPTALPATATGAVTQVANQTPGTAAATGQAAGGTFTFTGLQLDSQNSYKYHASVSVDGTLSSTGKGFHSSLTMVVQRQKSPLLGEYDIVLSDAVPNMLTFKGYLGGMYAQGNYMGTLVDDALYEVDGQSGRCRAVLKDPAPDTPPAKVQDIALTELNGFVLNSQTGDSAQGGAKGLHYTGSRKIGPAGEITQTLDIYVSADEAHVPLKLTENQTLDPKIKSTLGLRVFTLKLDYDLTTDIALSITKPVVCQNVPAK